MGTRTLSGPPTTVDSNVIGAWRSLVAHLLWEQGVAGSNPAAPIDSFNPNVRPSTGPAPWMEFYNAGNPGRQRCSAVRWEELVGSFYISEDVTHDGVVVLAAGGEIDYEASPHLRKCISNHLKAGSTRLMLDLSAATFIDSTAIGVIANSAGRMSEIEDGSLTLVCPSENDKVLQILEIAGLPAVVALHDSRDEALTLLAGDT